MASEQQILREYLVTLGYKIDGESSRRFDISLGKTNLNFKALGKTVLGVAAATSTMVTLFAKSMEELYYSSKKANTTVGNLQALEFAGKSIGLAGGSMKSALEGMARAIRLNPGLGALIESFGIQVKGRTMDKVAVDFLGVLKKMPFYQAAQYANLFGIGPDDLLLLLDGLDTFKQMAALRNQMAKDAGVDADEAARASVEYSRLFNQLTERVGLLGSALAIALLPSATKFLEMLNRGVEIATKWITGGGPQQAKNFKDATPEGTPYAAYQKIAGAARASFWNWLTGNSPASTPATATAPASGGDKLPLGLRQHNPGNLRSWGNAAVANGFATFGSDAEGLSAMAGNLMAYAKRGFNTIEKVINRWAPPGDNNDTGAYIKAVSSKLGIGAGQAIDFNDPKQLTALMGAIIQHEQGRNPYSQNDLSAAAASRGVLVQQTTNITVASSDPEVAGRAVARAQTKVNEDLASVIRNRGGKSQ